MANNNTMDLEALLNSYNIWDFAKGIGEANDSLSKQRNNIINANRKTMEDVIREHLPSNEYSDNTMNWLRDTYGINATNKLEATEQLAVLKALGEGKSKGMQMLEGAQAGADLVSKLAQMLPETKETVAAGPRGFGVVGRK